MMDPVRELKVRAEILKKALASADSGALERLRVLPEMRRAAAPALAATVASIRRKHCLAVVAREHGFSSWAHALRVLDGDPGEVDFGTMLYGESSGGFLHPWFATYPEARACMDDATRSGARPFLLAFGRQFFVAEGEFVTTLGLDPQDGDWQALAWDWARPRDGGARRRLYAKRLAALRGTR